jgi:lysophospholipase L1-like esterase
MRLLMLVGLLAVAQQIPQPPGPTPLTTELPPLTVTDAGLPTLFLVGDSTVKVGTAGQMGWGEVVGDYFDPARINVVNYARGGRSSRTFQTEALWSRVLAAMRPGDYVLIQFGHDAGRRSAQRVHGHRRSEEPGQPADEVPLGQSCWTAPITERTDRFVRVSGTITAR